MRTFQRLSAALLIAATTASAGEPARVQGQVAREGKTFSLTNAVAWQAARPDTLVLVLADTDIALMDVRHTSRLQQLAAEGKLHGLRFEFDPAQLDLHWISGRYLTPDWATYRGMPGTWERLTVANGHIAGKLDANGVKAEFDVPVTGCTEPKVLTGAEAGHTPQVEALLAYEDAVRKGNWKAAARLLTPQSAEVFTKEMSTKEGLGQFQTAGKYMKDFIPAGEARRALIQKVVTCGEDGAAIGDGFASDFVLMNGRWLKI